MKALWQSISAAEFPCPNCGHAPTIHVMQKLFRTFCMSQHRCKACECVWKSPTSAWTTILVGRAIFLSGVGLLLFALGQWGFVTNSNPLTTLGFAIGAMLAGAVWDWIGLTRLKRVPRAPTILPPGAAGSKRSAWGEQWLNLLIVATFIILALAGVPLKDEEGRALRLISIKSRSGRRVFIPAADRRPTSIKQLPSLKPPSTKPVPHEYLKNYVEQFKESRSDQPDPSSAREY